VDENRSIAFFNRQFEQQVKGPEPGLNPFEQAALPHLRGDVLDYGCGMGQLALVAARAGCSVLALDASEVAVAHLQRAAESEHLALTAGVADLRFHRLGDPFDTIVCIGLLMFFDCATAEQALAELEAHLRPGGTMIVNVLVEGTTYMDMFDTQSHCLFERDALTRRYAHWDVVLSELSDYPAPGGLNKAFATVIVRKPATA
jgi:tellurite methyltransferase